MDDVHELGVVRRERLLQGQLEEVRPRRLEPRDPRDLRPGLLGVLTPEVGGRVGAEAVADRVNLERNKN